MSLGPEDFAHPKWESWVRPQGISPRSQALTFAPTQLKACCFDTCWRWARNQTTCLGSASRSEALTNSRRRISDCPSKSCRLASRISGAHSGVRGGPTRRRRRSPHGSVLPVEARPELSPCALDSRRALDLKL